MSKLRTWRTSKGWTQSDLGSKLGLSSKGQVSRMEAGIGITTDLAIRIDRLTVGAVSVSDLRPDLRDVIINREPCAA